MTQPSSRWRFDLWADSNAADQRSTRPRLSAASAGATRHAAAPVDFQDGDSRPARSHSPARQRRRDQAAGSRVGLLPRLVDGGTPPLWALTNRPAAVVGAARAVRCVGGVDGTRHGFGRSMAAGRGPLSGCDRRHAKWVARARACREEARNPSPGKFSTRMLAPTSWSPGSRPDDPSDVGVRADNWLLAAPVVALLAACSGKFSDFSTNRSTRISSRQRLAFLPGAMLALWLHRPGSRDPAKATSRARTRTARLARIGDLQRQRRVIGLLHDELSVSRDALPFPCRPPEDLDLTSSFLTPLRLRRGMRSPRAAEPANVPSPKPGWAVRRGTSPGLASSTRTEAIEPPAPV